MQQSYELEQDVAASEEALLGKRKILSAFKYASETSNLELEMQQRIDQQQMLPKQGVRHPDDSFDFFLSPYAPRRPAELDEVRPHGNVSKVWDRQRRTRPGSSIAS